MTLPRTPSFRIDGKRALVTLASSGIGQGWAVALAVAGRHGVCATRGVNTLRATADDRAAWVAQKIKPGRIGEVEGITGAELNLAGATTALVTGMALLGDGGWTAA